VEIQKILEILELQCGCGIKLRVPADSPGIVFECPDCGGEFFHDGIELVTFKPQTCKPPDLLPIRSNGKKRALVICSGYLTQDNSRTAERYAERVVKSGYSGDIFHYNWLSGDPAVAKFLMAMGVAIASLGIPEEGSDRRAQDKALIVWIATILGASVSGLGFALHFNRAYQQAGIAGDHLTRFLSESMLATYRSVDLLGHSLGARVAIKAASESAPHPVSPTIRTLKMFGAAEKGNEVQTLFNRPKRDRPISISNTINRSDSTLNFAFRLAKFGRAIGSNGVRTRIHGFSETDATQDFQQQDSEDPHDYSDLPSKYYRLS